MLRLSLICTLLLYPLLSFGQDSAEVPKNIKIKPATLNFDLDKGMAAEKTISITNNTAKKLQFRTYLMDWLRDSIGSHSYYKADSLSISCAEWVSMDKDFVEVEPGATGEIRVRMKVPEATSLNDIMRWTMVFVESIEEKAAPQKGASVTNKMRVGVHVYQTPPQVTRGEMQILSFAAIKDSVNQYRVTCKNTGDVQIHSKMYIELSSLADGTKTVIDGRIFPTFPGQKREFNFIVPPTLPKGKYNAIAAVDAGDEIPLEALQAIIEVK